LIKFDSFYLRVYICVEPTFRWWRHYYIWCWLS